MKAPDSPASRSSAEPGLSYDLPYRSQRMPLFAEQAVATSNPLAAQAGLRVLESGGNAVDAAIAVAAALSVVEPTMNGVGGDLFAMVWDGERLHGLNASGRSPAGWSLERFAGRGAMPALGWDSVTVPGAVSGWAALHRRFGSRPFAELLSPAIRYARDGFPVMPRTAAAWADSARALRGFEEFARVFLPNGRSPRAGEWFQPRDLADTLADIAETHGGSFYSGAIAARIVSAAHGGGAALTRGDLAEHVPAWVEPIGCDYETARIYELPPNGQGLAASIALGILRHLPMNASPPEHPDSVHLQIEAMKLAFADCHAHVADPARMQISIDALLSEARLARLAAAIEPGRATPLRAAPPPDHGTVYAAIADRHGRMVSLIQSNYLGFGSGIVVPGTGIALHNRALGFSLQPEHPNCVAGGALPYHTIMPGFMTVHGAARMSFGVMGGHMQPQGHVQLVLRTLLHHQNPQAAIDAPRWYVSEQGEVALEPEFQPEVRESLLARGHRFLASAPRTLFGGAQAIYKLEHGYCAGSDPRKDGQAVGS